MSTAAFAAALMVTIILVTLLLGFPIGLSIGLGSCAAVVVVIPSFSNALLTCAKRYFTGANSFTLLAIPFFVLAGNIMNNGGIAKRLIGCARLVAHFFPGELAQTNIVANMLFGAISGSGVAAASAMGSILGPMEKEDGYEEKYSAAANIASGPTGMMIPPSNIMIVYAMAAGSVSIAALFMAGYVPGILWGVGCMILAGIKAKKRGYVSKTHYTLMMTLKVLWEGVPALFMIIVVIGGILGGIFTPTEGSAIAVMYSLILSFIYRNIKVSDLPRILLESMKTTAVIEFTVCVSSVMSWIMSYTKLPATIASAVLAFTSSPIVILIIMNIILLIVGCFMDPTPAVLIFTPIFYPICETFGMHAVHFGLMMVMNLCVGTLTPPVGAILFAGCRVAKVSIDDVIGELLPYFIVVLISLILITYLPFLSLSLPLALGQITVTSSTAFWFIGG